MSTFGDFDLDDAYDIEPPAPEQVAYKLHQLRIEVDALTGREGIAWDDLTPGEQQLALAIGGVVVQYIIDTEPEVAEDMARQLHNVRRYLSSSALPAWEDLPPDARQVAVDLMQLVMDWLQRQGALA